MCTASQPKPAVRATRYSAAASLLVECQTLTPSANPSPKPQSTNPEAQHLRPAAGYWPRCPIAQESMPARQASNPEPWVLNPRPQTLEQCI